MKNYVISLASALDRREHIEKEFAQQHIKFNFFDAITPALALSLASDMDLNYNEQYLTQGELACFMSHVSLWEKVVEENIPYMAIFEDDIYLGEDADKFLDNSTWVPCDVDIIKLEVTQSKVIIKLSHKINLENGRSLYMLASPHLGSGGYVVSRNGAKKLLSYIKNIVYLPPIDHILFDKLIPNQNVKILQMSPALCIQDIIVNGDNENSPFKSTLIKDRGYRMHKEKHTLIQKIKREILRLIFQLRDFFFSKEIKFR